MTDQMSSSDMGTPPAPAGQDNKQRNIIIIAAVAAGVLLCCCCILLLAFAVPWQDILRELDLTRILPLVMTL